MFNFFKKDPITTLEKEYARLMEQAMHTQRSGDLRAYADLIAAAEAVAQQIAELKAAKK